MAFELTRNLQRMTLQADRLFALQTLYDISYKALFDSQETASLADIRMAHAALTCISSFAGSPPETKRLKDHFALAIDLDLDLYVVDFQHIIFQALSQLKDDEASKFLELTAPQAEGANLKEASCRIVTHLQKKYVL